MIAIQYPSLPQGVDYEGIMGATQRGYNAGKDWRDEREFRKEIAPALAGSLYGQQAPQTLGGLSGMFAPPQSPNAVQRAPLPAPVDPATARVDQAFAAQGQGRGGTLPSVGEMRQYIAQAAQARGIDPAVAIRVAQSEGLAPNTWQSNVSKNGKREPSYGPFQMLVGGGDTGFPEGMGNAFAQQTGLDPSDPANWKKMTDFALDTASKQGWGQWYGAKAAGIGNMQGINGGSPSAAQPAQPQQVADASGSFMPQAQQPASILPPREVMEAMFRNPISRPMAAQLAQAAMKLRANEADPQAQIEYQIAVEKLRQLRSGGGDTEYGLTPIYGQDEQGNTVLGVLGKNGTYKQIDTGGITPSTGTGTVDLGTAIGTIDKRTGQIISTTPKENFQESFDKASGSEAGKTAAEMPKMRSKAIATLDSLDSQRSLVNDSIDRTIADIQDSPNLTTGIVGGLAKAVPGTPAYKIAKRLETIKANIGFDKLQSMRENSPTGGALGQVSDFENRQLQSVFGNLEQAQNAEELLYNLDQLKGILAQSTDARRRAFARDFGEGENAPQNGAPQPGSVVDGYRFKGGDPADQNSWEPVR